MIQRVSGLERRDAPQARVPQRGPAGGFGAMLQQELARQEQQPQGVEFSKHAISRAQERGMFFLSLEENKNRRPDNWTCLL